MGASSADIRCSASAALQSTLNLPSILHRSSTLGDWMDDPRGMQILAPFYQAAFNSLRSIVGGTEDGQISIETMAYLKSLPLIDLLEFPGLPLEKSPGETIDDMLNQLAG